MSAPQAPPPPLFSAPSDDIPTEVYEAMMISAYLNFCFFVAEIAFVAYGPQGDARHALDMMARGPLTKQEPPSLDTPIMGFSRNFRRYVLVPYLKV